MYPLCYCKARIQNSRASSKQNIDHSVVGSLHILVGYTYNQVVISVTIEITAGKGCSELVLLFI